ncbi:MAG: hypothetical protein EPN55_08035 [Gammaproteobacteria bacterium]|nr:MAG: hypothetical protein EPN55_08035 [Gammaproteobacteria bacterium]
MSTPYTEGERRLRALVRAFLSPGIWLVVGTQLALQLSLQQISGAGEAPLAWVLALSGLLLGFAWLQAGAYHALAQGRDRLLLADMARAGFGRFTRFLWMFIKLDLSVALLFNVVAFLSMLGSGTSPEGLVRGLAPFLGPLLAAVGFLFVYWLPLVFVTDDFRLFVTLRRALSTTWQRLPQSGFLALLILLPPALFTLLPSEAPLWLLVPLAVGASLLGWAAYIYCAEWLCDAAGASPSPAETVIP